MLDAGTLDQLKSVFEKLDSPIILQVSQSAHEQQAELLELLQDVASSSPLIQVQENPQESPVPNFQILKSQSPVGISFCGVPGGHEFSSLVLAILHANGKGKQPDSGIIERIRNLKGPIHLQTFMSLTCENCPDVVQALNLMASLHPDFRHEVIDGAFAQEQIQALGIQGVPAVVSQGKLLHSGKAQFSELLATLESAFGKADSALKLNSSGSLGQYQVVVLGGGPAGVSAAIYTARKGLKTALVAERLGGQLQDTKGIENMISVPYTEGVRLAAQLSEHLSRYPVQVFEHRRVSHIEDGVKKSLVLEGGEVLETESLIIATGAKWRQLQIPGEKEYIGRGVAFCAHCDGPFYRGKKVAVIGGGNSGVEAAIDLAGIAESVTLFEYNSSLKADLFLVEKLSSLSNTRVLTGVKTTQVLGDGSKVTGIRFLELSTQTESDLEIDGVFVQIGLLPNTSFLKDLVALTPSGEIVVDTKGRTSISGIYAAGDVTTLPFKQIVMAMGDGAKVALTVFEDRLHQRAVSSGTRFANDPQREGEKNTL